MKTLEDRAAKDPEGEKKRLVDAFSNLGIKPNDLQEYLGGELDRITPPELEDLRLIDFKVRILTPSDGTRAVTRVMIESADKAGEHWSTVGVSGNIIDASYNALRDSIIFKLLRDGVADSHS